MSYTIEVPYDEFREYLLESEENGPFGDMMFHQLFFPYCDGGCVRIEYKYGEYSNGKSTIKWRLADAKGDGLDAEGKKMPTHRIYKLMYGGSSAFAAWWCGMTDGIEDDE